MRRTDGHFYDGWVNSESDEPGSIERSATRVIVDVSSLGREGGRWNARANAPRRAYAVSQVMTSSLFAKFIGPLFSAKS